MVSISVGAEWGQASITIGHDQTVHCAGPWTVQYLSRLDRDLACMSWPKSKELICEMGQVTAMDTGGAVLLQRTMTQFRRQGRQVSVEGLRAEFA